MLQTAIPAPAEIRAVFEDVLSDSAFRRRGVSPIIGWLQTLAEAIERFLSRWIPVLGDTEARVLSWVLIAAAVGAALYLLLLRLGERAAPSKGLDAAPGFSAPRPRDAAEWLAWAREAAVAGRLRTAATGVYQATILRLDARGTLRYRVWKTPGDYAAEMPTTEPLRVPFMDFLGRFLELAFGPSEPTTERFEAFSAAASRMGGSA